ncbi:hypothetical protein K474DRAFT_669977 [Panus rudis PR-1116 ss-1]|nr:hypothetical protein K474DRAFT_669977 [Panus rudis PR-1116 ss-1]
MLRLRTSQHLPPQETQLYGMPGPRETPEWLVALEQFKKGAGPTLTVIEEAARRLKTASPDTTPTLARLIGEGRVLAERTELFSRHSLGDIMQNIVDRNAPHLDKALEELNLSRRRLTEVQRESASIVEVGPEKLSKPETALVHEPEHSELQTVHAVANVIHTSTRGLATLVESAMQNAHNPRSAASATDTPSSADIPSPFLREGDSLGRQGGSSLSGDILLAVGSVLQFAGSVHTEDILKLGGSSAQKAIDIIYEVR